ncbi:MAG: adenylate/guanylate cyclase domain-containing protein [Inquilinaceae bacterium]
MTPSATSAPEPEPPDAVGDAFQREERAGLAFALWGRLLVLGFLTVWVLSTLPAERSVPYAALLGLFMALGVAPYVLRRLGFGSWLWTAGFLTLDVALLTYFLVVPAPIFELTPQLNLRLPNFLYLGVFLVGMALSYSPGLVIWTGGWSILAWSAGVLWVVGLPESVAYTSVQMLDSGLFSRDEITALLLDENFVSLTAWYNQTIFLVLVTLILAVTAWRSRRLVRRQVMAEAARANLSRYFSPNLVDDLARSGESLDRVAVQKVAVLFVDMVGFTRQTEAMPPDRVIALLREYHGRLARVVFAHDGTVDKYIGDAVMAHFGTPRTRDDDPVRALACARAMLAEIDAWNRERHERGDPPIEVGIGLHCGEVVVGNVGDSRRLEYTVLGDTVNVANRLEALTRELDARLIVSDVVASEARDAVGSDPALMHGLDREADRTLRGRHTPVSIWVLRRPAAAPV